MKSVNDSKPLSVCFICPKAYPLFNKDMRGVFGGAEVDLFLLSTELAKDSSFKVFFVTADYGQDDVEMRQGVRIIKSLKFTSNVALNAVRLWSAMRKADARMYFLECASPGVPLAAVFCGSHRRALIYRTAHSDECDGEYVRRHPLVGRAFVWSLRKAIQVFVQNRSDGEALLRTAGIATKVMPNAHHIPTLAPLSRDTVLWVARSAAFKRPRLFLQLARELPTTRFTMVCPKATGDDSYEALVKEAADVPNLRFVQSVDFNKMDEYFQRAKVFVSTSESEGFANTFVQACKAGTPVLSLRVNPDGFLDKYNCGIACNDDWTVFKDALDRLISTPLGEQMGLSGRRYAMENHDLARIIETYKEHFIRIAQGKV